MIFCAIVVWNVLVINNEAPVFVDSGDATADCSLDHF